MLSGILKSFDHRDSRRGTETEQEKACTPVFIPPRTSANLCGERLRLRTNTRQFAAAAADAAAVMPAGASLAKLLASHILRDGEVVLLILRPSLWFVPLSCIQFLTVALVLTVSVRFMNIQSHATSRSLIECGVSAISARLVWATLQWFSRLYILTDMRLVSIAGVFQMQIFDCPLRKVVRTRVTRTDSERLTATGSIEIVPQDETSPFGEWKTIAHPVQIHDQIVAAINKAKQ